MNRLVEQLSQSQQKLYSAVIEGIKKFDKKISIEKNLTDKEVKKVLSIITDNECDLFYANLNEIQIINGAFSKAIHIQYRHNKSDALEIKKKLEQKRDYICANFQGRTPVEATEYIHDYLANTVRYDFSALNGRENGICFTIEGALLQELAVCHGIALAAKYLLEGLGVESLVVSGALLSSEDKRMAGTEHAWNMNILPEGNYHMDITNDLKDTSPIYTISHVHCNVDENLFIENYDWDFLKYPRALSKEGNYFVRRNTYFRTKTMMDRYVEKCVKNRNSVLTFQIDPCAGFPEDTGKFLANRVLSIAARYYHGQVSIQYLYDEEMMVITIVLEYQ